MLGGKIEAYIFDSELNLYDSVLFDSFYYYQCEKNTILLFNSFYSIPLVQIRVIQFNFLFVSKKFPIRLFFLVQKNLPNF